MSTLPGKVAYRGVFTGALAREFAKADDKLSIYDMIDRAKLEMERITTTHSVNQVALMTSTLTKSLVFPPPGGDQQQRTSQPRDSSTTTSLIQRLENFRESAIK